MSPNTHPHSSAPAADAPSGGSKRIRLVVLFGGQSAEHDVSRTTAAHVLAAVDPARYDIVPVGISRDGQWALASGPQTVIEAGDRDFGDQLSVDGAPIGSPNAAIVPLAATEGDHDESDVDSMMTVVLPLLHGPMGEDGTVQGMLELLDVAYVGDGVLASAMAMDKTVAKQIFDAAGIPQARHLAIHDREIDDIDATVTAAIEHLGLPLFVKPANMGSSVGVSRAATHAAAREALERAFSYDEWAVIEEAVVGREIELAVIGNDNPFVSVPGEIIPGDDFYSYDDKYLNGVSHDVIPAELSTEATAEVQRLAIDAYRALRCSGLARCDFFYEPGGRGFLCNEVNTMPGFTPISMFPKLLMASGWTYGQIVDRLVELALERHGRRRRNTSR